MPNQFEPHNMDCFENWQIKIDDSFDQVNISTTITF